MKRRRGTFATLVAALSLASFSPATAWANPLLSGYGGPGQGSQAILGAQLLGGPTGGGGGRPSAGGGSQTSASSSARPAGTPSSGHGAGHEAGARRARGSAPTSTVHGGPRAAGAAPARQTPPERAIAVGSDGLGLSDADILDAVLVLLVLAFTAGLTAVLVRRPPSGYGG